MTLCNTSLSYPSQSRNVTLLALCQGLWLSVSGTSVTLSAVVGAQLADAPSLATVPYGLLNITTALCAAPASLLMGRFGRALGFALGAAAGVLGAALAAWAIMAGDFGLFCAGSVLLGVYQASTLYYRFAAGEAVPESARTQAISLVLAGGVAAAFVGPQLAARGRDLLAPYTFAGSFAMVAGLAALSLAAALTLRMPRPAVSQGDPAGRPIGAILRQPVFRVAVLNAVAGFAVMAFVMTATPLAMLGCGFGVPDAAHVIQWHIFSMFAPSFVTGAIIGRFGPLRVMLVGNGLLLASAGVATSGLALWQFTTALVLLGVGWNFMYVGATALIAQASTPGERAKTQAASEFLTFCGVALATMLAGGVLASAGWQGVNVVTAPVLVLAGAAALRLFVRHRRRPSGTLP